MYDLLIKDGTIVTANGKYKADIKVDNEKIVAIGHDFCEDARKVLDASDKWIFPGAVDAHFHIGEYDADFEDMKTSTMAAAAGGVTTGIDMPLNLYSPSVLTKEAVVLKEHRLNEESYIDFVMWGGITPSSIPNLQEMHRAGTVSYKCFMSGGGNDFQAPTVGQIREAMKIIASFNGLAGFHCEDFSIIDYERKKVRENKLDGRQAFLDSRPLVAELIATQTIIYLAEETKCRVHICHVSAPEVARLIEDAQNRGVDITAETCPHYLTFCDQDYLTKGCAYGCAPPIKSMEKREELWKYVEKGVLSCIASDHSPGLPENRSDEGRATYETGFGISGVQTMFQVIYDQAVNKRKIAPELVASRLSTNPAIRWGLYGTKGDIKEGFDADLIIVDPEKEWKINQNELYYKVKLTAFHELTGKGTIVNTFIRGHEVYNGNILVSPGFGQNVLKN